MEYRALVVGFLVLSCFSRAPAFEPDPASRTSQPAARNVPILVVSVDTLWDTLLTGGKSSATFTIINLDTASRSIDLTVEYPRPPIPLLRTSWPTMALPFIDDFEDGDYDGWTPIGTAGVWEVTDTTAAQGTHSLYTRNNQADFGVGVTRDFEPGRAIDRMSFYVRPGSSTETDAYMYVLSSAGQTLIYFFAAGDGFLRVNAGTAPDAAYPYSADTWYLVEFLNFDWALRRFDYYVNGTLVEAGVGFYSTNSSDVGELRLFTPAYLTEAWWDDIRLDGPNWLSVAPDSVTLTSGGNQLFDVNFDASGLSDGDSVAHIIISTESPTPEQDTITVFLHVTGAPDIELSADTLYFDTLFIDNPRTDTLEVYNSGVDTLQVLLVSSSHPDYSVGAATFSLAPYEFQAVPVTFVPTTTGAVNATLSISSNDPDQSTLEVVLTGTGLEPPVIEVSPPDIYDSLASFDSSLHTLTIVNSGLSNLLFNVGVIDQTPLAGSPTSDSLAFPPYLDDFEDGDLNGWITQPATDLAEVTTLTAASGSHSFHLHSGGASGGPSQGIYREFITGSQTPEISAWVRAGSTTRKAANLRVRAANGRPVLEFYANSDGNFVVNSPSWLTTGPYQDSTWYHVSFRNINWATRRFDFYLDGMLIMDSISFRDPIAQNIGKVEFFNQDTATDSWWDDIRFGTSFVSAVPTEGIIPPGDFTDLAVKFASSNLASGDYTADIRIRNNDSDKTPFVVAANLHVTGFPLIDVQPDSLYLDSVLVGDTAFAQILVSNPGTESLHVSMIASDQAEWTASPTAFNVGPARSQVVDIQFVPLIPGLRVATLTLTCDADSTPTVIVPLVARSITPGMMEVVGLCPADRHMYEGGSFAIQVNSRLDSAEFGSMNLLRVRKDGQIHLPKIGPTMTGLDQVDAPWARRLITYWKASPGEAGTWEFCFYSYDHLGVSDTFCVELLVEAPGPDHVEWSSRHIRYNAGSGPFDKDLQLSTFHGYDITYAVVFPFLVWQESGTAFIAEPILATDIDYAPEYYAAFESFGANLTSMDTVSPDSLLFGGIDFGGPTLPPGGPYTSTITFKLRDQEGIIRIDSTPLPPANSLSFVSEQSGLVTVTPTFSPGCFPVTIGPPCAVTMTGDANVDDALTTADVILLVSYVFKSGSPPAPCAATGDVNCNGSVNASDIIYLVNTIFKGGPAPCDVCTLSPDTWVCP